MPATAAQHLPRRARARGFTLIEILVVVFIIGLLAVGAVLSLGGNGRDTQLEQERDRLSALIAYTRERGSMLTLEYGIRCGQHGYAFVVYDARSMQWTEDTSDDTLKLRKLPDGLQLQLVIEGHQIVLDDKALAKPATQSSGTNPSTLNTVGASNPFAATSATDANGNALSSSSTAVGAGAAGSGLGSATGSSGSSLSSGSSTASSSSSSSSSSTNGSGSLNSTQVNTYTPQVMLFSNGDTNSFALTLSREGSNRSVTLQSSEDGSVQVGDIVEPKS